MDKIKKENQMNGVIINMQLKIFDFLFLWINKKKDQKIK